jgi:hypothetical protein
MSWSFYDSSGKLLTSAAVPLRVSTEVSSATPTINTDLVDAHSITELAVAITSMTQNLSGSPVNFQKLIIRFLDNNTNRAISWGASFTSMGVTLPTTTAADKLLTVGLIYNTVTSDWECVASVEEA